jgi:TPR repeat protein
VYYQRAAAHDVVSAFASVGLCYEHGLIGGYKDVERAVQWYKKAARRGDLKSSTRDEYIFQKILSRLGVEG